MNEARKLYPVPASDAAALANALGWDSDTAREVCGEAAGQMKRCAQCAAWHCRHCNLCLACIRRTKVADGNGKERAGFSHYLARRRGYALEYKRNMAAWKRRNKAAKRGFGQSWQ